MLLVCPRYSHMGLGTTTLPKQECYFSNYIEFVRKQFCWKFNKNGNCDRGFKCAFDHKCSYCAKHGHGYFECRKRLKAKDNKDKEESGKKKIEKVQILEFWLLRMREKINKQANKAA